MEIYFITGNKNKFEEAKSILPELQQLEIDLPEIQEVDSRAIIEAKLQEALRHKKEGFVVEDTSLDVCGMNGLPGPLIKWFLKSLGNDGIAKMAKLFGNGAAVARTTIGYANDKGEIHFFVGEINGTIVLPRGSTNFGWDPIFEPAGFGKTFAEMTPEEKNSISMRKKAFQELKNFLENQK